MRIASALLVLILSAPAPAWAQAEDDRCADAESTVEINQCLSAVFEQADAELNRVYRAAMASIDTHDHMPARTRRDWQQLLREAQRHWVGFKEKDCDLFYMEWWQGSGATAASLSCQIGKTQARTAELQERYGVK